jgi:hypothetical protein
VIHELQRRPLERRRLRSILIEGRKIPFSRNDPILASLEMIGAIRPAQPCAMRNQLYERALRVYYEMADDDASARSGSGEMWYDEHDEMYSRLLALRGEALDDRGAYVGERYWETFAAALYSLVPAFSIHPQTSTGHGDSGVVLAVDSDAPGGDYWSTYSPAVRVECCDLRRASLAKLVPQMAERAAGHRARLVFLIASGAARDAQESVSRTRRPDDPHIALITDEDLSTLLEQHGDVDEFMRNRVLQARLYEE